MNISLTTISGKEIKKEIVDKANYFLSLSELNPGMYFLKFNSGEMSVVRKIMKQ